MSNSTIKQIVMDAYQFRHSTKEFDEARRVSDDDLRFILETGRLSPSSFGYEPWKFIVLENQEIREHLKPHVWGASNRLESWCRVVLILARKAADLHPDSAYVARMIGEVQGSSAEIAAKRLGAYRGFFARSFVGESADRAAFDWACKQTYIALGNMLTTAALIGIDSCPIEGFNRPEAQTVLEGAGVYDPAHFDLSCMAVFGYRKKEPRGKRRRCYDEVVQVV